MCNKPPLIICNNPRLSIAEHIDKLRAGAETGAGIIWDLHGMTRCIRGKDLVEALRIYDDATMNTHSRVRVPDRAAYIYWF